MGTDLASRFLVILGDRRDGRAAAVGRHLGGRGGHDEVIAADWPFQRDVLPPGPAAPVIWIRDLHLAFPAGQTAGTRLVLTQSTYQLQRWLDWLDRTPGVTVVADADRSSLRRSSPESGAGRGPWNIIAVTELDADAAPPGGTPSSAQDERGRDVVSRHPLHAAFMQQDPDVRLDACRRAADGRPEDAAVQLAFASTCMELQLLDDAEAALARAAAAAPDWEAVHFERGKLLLRREETERAAAAFADAARLMPSFAAALLNLGGALGELGRRAEARAVLERARIADPRSHTALNNLGAVYREEGLLEDAVGAFRGVIELAPGFVFGYYNLAQTLLLMGDVDGARRTYEEGFARDPQKNPRQACRLAVARAAAGDADGALELIERLVADVPPERMATLFEEAESTIDALSPRLSASGEAMDRLRAVIRSYSS